MKPDYEIGIVGAGFAGLIAALRLKNADKNSFIVFERALEIGGTWRDNVYPGAACDVASPLYSFYDAPNPNWNNLFSSQQEILNYMKITATSFHLSEHIRLNSDITETIFLEDVGLWKVTDANNKVVHVRILILATGPLNRPNIPMFNRLEEFKGSYFHTSNWDTSYNLNNKRVAIIGTGASAIQVIPEIAPKVKHLTIFQRTPAWVADRNDKRISSFKKRLYKLFPKLQKIEREIIYWLSEFLGVGFLGNKIVNKAMSMVALRKLRKEVIGTALQKKLIPTYKIGCKRILKSDDYYPTFNRDNVSLVTEGITSFTKDGILTVDGKEHQFDLVILATGFEAAEMNIYTKVIGTNKIDLLETWKETGPEAYLGTTVSGFPNMAFILGPNTGLGHTSILHIMESQMNYIMQYIGYIEQSGYNSFVDLDRDIQREYNSQIQEKLKKTVWNSGCKSWYLNLKGKNTTIFPGLTTTFRKQTKHFNPTIYKVVKIGQPALAKSAVTI